jgi:hypothetical protein
LIEKRYTLLTAMQAARELEYDPRAHTRRAIIYAIARRSRHAADRRADRETAFSQIERIKLKWLA